MCNVHKIVQISIKDHGDHWGWEIVNDLPLPTNGFNFTQTVWEIEKVSYYVSRILTS